MGLEGAEKDKVVVIGDGVDCCKVGYYYEEEGWAN